MQVANHVLERLGAGQVTAELLQPDELVSGMMAQIAAEPSMAHLLTDFIYSPEGGRSSPLPCLPTASDSMVFEKNSPSRFNSRGIPWHLPGGSSSRMAMSADVKMIIF